MKQQITVALAGPCLGLLGLLGSPLAASAWTLEGYSASWTIDRETGAIESAATADGFAAIGACADRYVVAYPDRSVTGSEANDIILQAETNGLPDKLALSCKSEPLSLSITKTYRVDPETGWLRKETSVVAPALDLAFLHLVSNLKVTSSLWNGGVLHHPVWHSGNDPIVPTSVVEDRHRFTVADGTGLMCLTNPRRNLTAGHVRLRSNGKPVFWDYIAAFGGGLVKHPETGQLVRYEVEGIDSGTVVEPTGWRMSVMHGAIGNGVTVPVSVEVACALQPGDFFDFQLDYVRQPNVYDLLHYEAATAPDWIDDVLITNWEDYQVTPENNDDIEGRAWGKLFAKMWFGTVVNVNFGFYEATYEYPPNDEAWETAYATLPEANRKHLTYAGLKEEEVFIRDDPPHMVTRSRWKPSHHKASNQRVLTAAGNPDRLKICPYSHIGHVGFDRAMKILEDHPEIVLKKKDGEPYRHAMDYNMDWENPVGMRVQGASPVVQGFWIKNLDDQFAFMDQELTYIDGIPRNATAVDWGKHVATTDEGMYPMYAGLVDGCRKHDGAMFRNYPVPLYSDMGYSEFGWWGVYRADWRAYSCRQAVQQVYARRGQPITICGHNEGIADEPMRSASGPMRLHSMLLLNHRLSMLNFGPLRPMMRLKYYLHSMPWLQAVYELRLREFVNPHVTPRWWTEDTELESHGYRLDKGTGLVVFMNHETEPLEEKVAFETAPLGVKKGKPAWVWRIQLPHPLEVDYSDVTETSPIRRLAKQTLVAYHEKLPKVLTYEEAWPADTPVILLVTQSPALVESVDGKPSQLWLPHGYDTTIQGVRNGADGRTDLTIKNRHDVASILLPMAGDRTPGIQMRRLDAVHEAGVLPAFEKLEGETIERNGATFLRLRIPKGTQEIVVE